jgi:hypothetical protein
MAAALHLSFILTFGAQVLLMVALRPQLATLLLPVFQQFTLVAIFQEAERPVAQPTVRCHAC